WFWRCWWRPRRRRLRPWVWVRACLVPFSPAAGMTCRTGRRESHFGRRIKYSGRRPAKQQQCRLAEAALGVQLEAGRERGGFAVELEAEPAAGREPFGGAVEGGLGEAGTVGRVHQDQVEGARRRRGMLDRLGAEV